ncbi:MAG: hypothetical protein ACREMY_25175, partial [bacterium]
DKNGAGLDIPAFLLSHLSDDPVTYTNIARVLMMLDKDQDPRNGITISAAIQDAHFQKIDWTTTDLENAAAPMVAEATSLDGTPHRLPTAAEAAAHLYSTWLCATAGLYDGSTSGQFGTETNSDGKPKFSGGHFGLIVTSDNRVFASIEFNSDNALDLRRFVVEGSADAATRSATASTMQPSPMSATFKWDDAGGVTGQWQTPEGFSGGTSATRTGVPNKAAWRFVTYPFPWQGATGGDFVSGFQLDIDTAGTVSGTWGFLETMDNIWQWHGNANADGSLSALVGTPDHFQWKIDGVLDRQAATATGTVRNFDGSVAKTFDVGAPLIGCRL